MCQMREKRESKNKKKSSRVQCKKEWKMRRRPMKLKHLPTRWNFLYSLCTTTTLTDPFNPVHADWNPINDGEKIAEEMGRRKICKAFNWFFTLSQQAATSCGAAEPSCLLWLWWANDLEKGQVLRGARLGVATRERESRRERKKQKSFFKMPNALRR